LQPLVYVTYRAYLRGTPSHLAPSIAPSRECGYALGVKLVRGACHPHGTESHIYLLATMSMSTDLDPLCNSSKTIATNRVSIIVGIILDEIGSSSTLTAASSWRCQDWIYMKKVGTMS
ncbi:hypothetical protein EDC04DRAFT_2557329, partial [Pisolithus marmoratus]